MVICVAQERSGYVCQNEPAMAKEIPQKTSVTMLCSSLERHQFQTVGSHVECSYIHLYSVLLCVVSVQGNCMFSTWEWRVSYGLLEL